MIRALMLVTLAFVLGGCMLVDETDRQAVTFAAAALPDHPELAKPVLDAEAARLGPPKEAVPVTEEGRDTLVAEAEKPREGKFVTFGKAILGVLTVTLLGSLGIGPQRRDC